MRHMDQLKSYFDAERGRLTRLAEMLAISPAAVSQWDRVPAERVLEVERATGVSRHELRPDLYPVEVP
jgi:DNA-binding transcriptional regulator YdaS (Cro superfamily)